MNSYYLQWENEGIPYSLNDEHFDFGSKLKIVLSVLQHSIQLKQFYVLHMSIKTRYTAFVNSHPLSVLDP